MIEQLILQSNRFLFSEIYELLAIGSRKYLFEL